MKTFLLAVLPLLALNLFAQTCDPTVYDQGEATYYNLLDQGSQGRCTFKNVDVQPYYGALYTPQYATAAMCGVCAEVTGLAGTRIIEVVDECPTCHVVGDIDLGPQAFQEIVGPLSIGRSPISWHIVRCPWADDPVKVTTQGSNYWWAKVIVARHKSQIQKVEMSNGTAWIDMVREADNGWVAGNLSQEHNPHTVRVTDIYGEMIEVDGIDLSTSDAEFIGDDNFVGCVTTGQDDALLSSDITVFPNPATSELTIQGAKGVKKIVIVDVFGNEKADYEWSSKHQSLSLAELPQGIYFLKFIEDGKNLPPVKIIKE